MGKLFIISGPSGVGKNTVVQGVLQDAGLNVAAVKTYTTRPTRPDDPHEFHYRFVSQPQFDQLKQSGALYETNQYNGFWYGSSKQEIEQTLNQGKNVLMVLDIHGGLAYKKEFPDATLIFLNAAAGDIRDRLEARAVNTPEEIEKRMKIAVQELETAKQYDHVIENPQENPQQAVEEVKKIIREHLA